MDSTDESYAIIHQLITDQTVDEQHLGSIFLSSLLTVNYFQEVRNFRYDTHVKNRSLVRRWDLLNRELFIFRMIPISNTLDMSYVSMMIV